MNPPPQLVQWLRQNYPKPSVDGNWLQQCYTWVIEEHSLNPATDMAKIMEHVESQLLMSDITDSMVSGSGLPHDLPSLHKGSLSGPPVLVQILALTEIGHSAFNLMNVRQAKADRADLSGLARADNDDEADEGPVPNYPRSMLHFQLSDGTIRLNAIEYKKIPQLDLENTPLGYKMLLKNVTIRHGIAFLEPRTIVLKGYGVEDIDANRDRHFLRGLKTRLDPNAQHEPDIEEIRDEQPAPPVLAPAPWDAPAPIPESPLVAWPPIAAMDNLNAPTQAIAPILGPLNNVVRSPPVDSERLRRMPSPADDSRQPGPSTSNPALATSSHFRTQSPTLVAPMRLSPTRASTEPLADDPPEPGSDYYFKHDDIDAAFLSRAASELERSEATLAQSSQQALPPPSQPRREVFFVDDDDDKENTSVKPRAARSRQLVSEASVIDLSAEIVNVGRIRSPPTNDDGDVISIGSDD
ncbi:hypothetical protein EDB87DRAFT_1626557 [Lactarius vividus]|nr:hypothetical protein EDB87DRAFT_1626557 [Lactarius vividus]